jgi:hypothetical protein
LEDTFMVVTTQFVYTIRPACSLRHLQKPAAREELDSPVSNLDELLVAHAFTSSSQRRLIVVTRPDIRWTTMFVFAFVISLLSGGLSQGQDPKQDKQLLAKIKASLPPKGNKVSTWYVLRLETLSAQPTPGAKPGRSTTVTSQLSVQKVQGQDEAAQAVLEHLKSGPTGTQALLRG